jgi:hypothetical protein
LVLLTVTVIKRRAGVFGARSIEKGDLCRNRDKKQTKTKE